MYRNIDITPTCHQVGILGMLKFDCSMDYLLVGLWYSSRAHYNVKYITCYMSRNNILLLQLEKNKVSKVNHSICDAY